MTAEEITEGNKLIAEFMGYKYFPHPENKNPGWKVNANIEKGSKIGYLCRNNHNLRYYNSWSWIMPVLDKIERMGFLTAILYLPLDKNHKASGIIVNRHIFVS